MSFGLGTRTRHSPKHELVQPTALILYDPKAAIKVSANPSSFGLGAVLLQESADGWKPVAYVNE